MKFTRFLTVFLILAGYCMPAHALCLSPKANAGTIDYFNNRFNWCDGTNWVSMVGLGVQVQQACSTAGQMYFDTSDKMLKFCDGTLTNKINAVVSKGVGCTPPLGATISAPGALDYNGGLKFCDGLNWVAVPCAVAKGGC